MANVASWVWEIGTQRYRNLTTGRFIGRTEVVELVNGIVDRTTDNPVSILNTMLADKRLNTADWQTGFARQIKNAYAQQAMLAAGGRDQMTPQLWGIVGGTVREQYNYLSDFAKEIAKGNLTAAQIEARTKMYTNSAREAYWRVKDVKARGEGMTEERWQAQGDASTCGPCAEADAMGWQPIGTFAQPGSGRVLNSPQTNCQGLTNCRCSKEYRTAAGQEERPEREPSPIAEQPPQTAQPVEDVTIPETGVVVTVGDVDPSEVYATEQILRDSPEWLKPEVKTIILHKEKGPSFTAGGKTFETGATYQRATQTIEVYHVEEGGQRMSQMGDTLSHELGHGFFDSWWEAANQQDNAVWNEHPGWFRMDGNVKPEYQAAFEAQAPLRSLQSKFTSAWNRGEDGVTPYSEAWAKDGHFSETAAELMALYNQTGWNDSEFIQTATQRGAGTLARSLLDAIKWLSKNR